MPILEINSLGKTFTSGRSRVRAVHDVTFQVQKGECLAIVGESGSGKSTIANMILGIYPPTTGSMVFEGQPLPGERPVELRRAIQLVQQNPLSSLNPKHKVATSLRLALNVHKIGEPSERPRRIAALLEEVGLPADFAARYPNSLSGGQRQRVAIARALACQSGLLVLDEPTSALDVLVQARVLKLLNDLRQKRALTYIFITHDLSVVRNISDRVAVFKQGELVELNDTTSLFNAPAHPYTRALLGAVPVVTPDEIALRQTLALGEKT